MTFTDPVANMLTSIRNANMRSYHSVSFPYSAFKWRVSQKLKDESFLSGCWSDEKKRQIKVRIKYNNKDSHIHQIKKISKPSQHIHWKISDIKRKCHGYGVYLISTSQGLLTHREALAKNLGGKAIFFIS
jgi:small subunit ribosomal protein S8